MVLLDYVIDTNPGDELWYHIAERAKSFDEAANVCYAKAAQVTSMNDLAAAEAQVSVTEFVRDLADQYMERVMSFSPMFDVPVYVPSYVREMEVF